MTPFIVISAFVLATIVTLGVPTTLFIRARSRYTRLPKSGVRVKGAVPVELGALDDAIMSFIERWGAWGLPGVDKVIAAFVKLRVEVMPEDDFIFAKYPGRRFHGLAVSKSFVMVFLEKALGRSAFFHELGHIAVMAVYPGEDQHGILLKEGSAHAKLIAELKNSYL